MWRWALVLLVLARSALAAEPPHLALIVGNSAYQNLPALPDCQASMAVVSAALNRAGWTVTQLRDPSNGQLSAGLALFADAVAKAPGASALVYACGYAAAFESRLFLLPASARLVRETDALTEGVVLPALTGVMSRADVGAGLIVADLVALPGKPAVPADAAARRGPGPRTGLLVASAAAGGPEGPTPTSAALANALTERDLSVGKAQFAIGNASAGALYVRLVNEDAPNLREKRPDLPAALAAAVARSLARSRDQRFASASAMADALRAAVGGSEPAERTVVMPGRPEPAACGVFDDQAVAVLERKLAEHVGPIARYLMQSAVRQSGDVETLCATLAANIELPADRDRFTKEARATLMLGGTTLTARGLTLEPAELERLQTALARHLGPVARVLIKRALPKAASVPALWQELASHIDQPEDRTAFLRQAPSA